MNQDLPCPFCGDPDPVRIEERDLALELLRQAHTTGLHWETWRQWLADRDAVLAACGKGEG